MLKRFLILPLTFVCAVSCQPKEEEKETGLFPEPPLDPQVEDLERRLLGLQRQLEDEQNLRLQQTSEQAALLAKMKGLLLGESDTGQALPEVVGTPVVNDDEMAIKEAELLVEESGGDEDAEARRAARLKAQGEEHAVFTTVSGESFKEVVINRVTDIGVVFRHSGGVARIPFSDLTVAWQDRFYYDADRAILAEKHERLALARYDRAAALRVAQLEKKRAEDAEAESLESLARAVEDLKQREASPERVVEVHEEIIVHPPIIVNSNRGHRGGHPVPVVRPPVVRTPTGTIPTVRPPSSRPTIVRPTTNSRPTTNPRPTSRPPVSPRPTKPTTRPTTSRPTTVRPTTSRPTTTRPAPSRR